MVDFVLGSCVGQMATQISFTGTVADNDDAKFPFVAVVAERPASCPLSGNEMLLVAVVHIG